MTPTETVMVVIGGGILVAMILMETYLFLRELRRGSKKQSGLVSKKRAG